MLSRSDIHGTELQRLRSRHIGCSNRQRGSNAHRAYVQRIIRSYLGSGNGGWVCCVRERDLLGHRGGISGRSHGQRSSDTHRANVFRIRRSECSSGNREWRGDIYGPDVFRPRGLRCGGCHVLGLGDIYRCCE